MVHKENFLLLPELKKTDEVNKDLSDSSVHWKAGKIRDCSF